MNWKIWLLIMVGGIFLVIYFIRVINAYKFARGMGKNVGNALLDACCKAIKSSW